MPSIVNWHQNPFNHHQPACDCEYTDQQKQQQQHEPHQLPAVGSRDLIATPTTHHRHIQRQACRNNYWAGWWIHGWWWLGCSRDVGCCAKGFHTATWYINLLRTYGLTSMHSWLDAGVDVPKPFRSSTVDGLSSHPGSKLPSRHS